MSSMAISSLESLEEPSRSALLTTKMSAISRMPALMAWISSPMPGTSTTRTVWEWLMMSTSCWPVPTVSTMMMSLPRTSITWMASPTALARPPRAPRVARLRTKTPGSSAWRCMRMRSPRMAPPVKGLVGSTASTPTVLPFLRKQSMRPSVSVLFPAPGEPVMPMTWAFPVRGKRCLMVVFASGMRSSRLRMRREAARMSPPLIFFVVSIPDVLA